LTFGVRTLFQNPRVLFLTAAKFRSDIVAARHRDSGHWKRHGVVTREEMDAAGRRKFNKGR
jgi:hypothetical protein